MMTKTQESTTPKWRKFGLLAAALFIIGTLAVVLVRLRQMRAGKDGEEADKLRMPVITSATGLSEEEAAARLQPDQDNVLYRHPRRTRRQLIRASTFTIFNLNLIALSAVQFLLGSISGGLISLGVLLLNVGLNVFQEEFARFRLRDLLAAARPQATVIREGKVRSIDPSEIVVGDILANGPGDQVMVDGIIEGEGEMVVEERLYGDEPSRVRKSARDLIYAGSICISGHATYRVKAVGEERQIVKQMQETEAAAATMTPIEKILNRVMRILLVVVFLLGILLLLQYFRLGPTADDERIIDAANVIFNVAPASLFFMVVLTYVSATADLGKIGALVYDSRSIESLADTDTVCFAKEGILTGTSVDFAELEDGSEAPPLAEARVRQILGSIARSSSGSRQIMTTLAASFPGERRDVVEEASFFSVYGWSAVAFDEEDLRGAYVLAVPQVLPERKTGADEENGDEDKQSIVSRGATSLARPFGRFFGRGKKEAEEVEEVEDKVEQEQEAGAASAAAQPEEEAQAKEDVPEPARGLFGRVRRGIGGLVPRRRPEPEESEEEEADKDDPISLIFAYTPEVTSLYSTAGQPQLPTDLIPLGRLIFQEQVHPDAVPAIEQFAARDVDIKIFTPGAAQKTIAMLTQAGLRTTEGQPIQAVSGSDLAALTPDDMAKTALDNHVFGEISPRQTEQVVRVLHTAGRAVGVVADSAGDVNTLRQGDLAITRGSSSPAALSQADIVLVGDSPAILSRVVEKGQRIVNGLLDVLKLYLTQAFYLVLLLIFIPWLLDGFPYTSAQGGMIALFALTLPAVGLSIWAPAGQLQKASLGQVLARFVVPAAFTMAAAGMMVYAYYLDLSGSIQYAQVALMHMLVAMGLLLVLIIQPPLLFSRRRGLLVGNWPVTVIVVISAILFWLATIIPLTQELLQLDPLQEPAQYVTITGAALLWALALRLVWFILPVERPMPVVGSIFQE